MGSIFAIFFASTVWGAYRLSRVRKEDSEIYSRELKAHYVRSGCLLIVLGITVGVWIWREHVRLKLMSERHALFRDCSSSAAKRLDECLRTKNAQDCNKDYFENTKACQQ